MRSEAQKKADRKYHAKTYKNLQISAKIADYEMIDAYCKKKGISKAQLLISSVKYCIVHNIDLHENIEIPENSDGNGADDN